ncbi:MAG TPA: hypothetical protein VK469_13150 [Candidatus Kapabacteria bacterium]|nr:hypothetical protein [Candidatus Kapabacteria bacterium]
MDEKKQAIVLLNDGEKIDKEGHCNSWPYALEYEQDIVHWPRFCE